MAYPKDIELAEKRAELAALKMTLESQHDVMLATAEAKAYAKTSEQFSALTSEVANLEHEIKGEKLDIFEETGVKDFDVGQVKNFTVVEYDEAAAIRWAIDSNQPGVLKLDNAKFKKAAAALEIDFVTIRKVARMTLKSDLSFLLEGGDR
jgi:hypothetical protein